MTNNCCYYASALVFICLHPLRRVYIASPLLLSPFSSFHLIFFYFLLLLCSSTSFPYFHLLSLCFPTFVFIHRPVHFAMPFRRRPQTPRKPNRRDSDPKVKALAQPRSSRRSLIPDTPPNLRKTNSELASLKSPTLTRTLTQLGIIYCYR